MTEEPMHAAPNLLSPEPDEQARALRLLAIAVPVVIVSCLLMVLVVWRLSEARAGASDDRSEQLASEVEDLRSQAEDLRLQVQTVQRVSDCRASANAASDDARFTDRIEERIAVGYILQSSLDLRNPQQLVADLQTYASTLLLPEPELTRFLRDAQRARALAQVECTPEAIEARLAAGGAVASPSATTTTTAPGGTP